jgi:2-oxoglutarate dehydrogenase E2 component (dihydrolipoamide succinyltransferase)
MMADVQVPRLAESISEAVLAEWLREDGATVRADEPIATLETDKAAVEIAASAAGVLRHARKAGDKVTVGDVLARIEAGAKTEAAAAPPARGAQTASQGSTRVAAPPAPAAPAPAPEPRESAGETGGGNGGTQPLSPAVRRLVEEHGLAPGAVPGTGKGGRVLKEDVLRHLASGPPAAAPATPPAAPTPATAATSAVPAPGRVPAAGGDEDDEIVPMSRIRQRIAERLVQAQHTAAILTTFNEIDMTAVLDLRARFKERFEQAHGVRLGFMSFFTRACVLAFHDVPAINAEIRGTDMVVHQRVHMGIAVGTPRGLVVPVIRDAHRLSFSGLEREIERLAARARDGSLTLDELTGGTFTISNGGVYGSLLSTPILNPPQSGILGMHKIEKRPIAVNDQVVVRPMMYVALSYDHRIVDGEQAVTFLVRVKERLEDPERMLFEL